VIPVKSPCAPGLLPVLKKEWLNTRLPVESYFTTSGVKGNGEEATLYEAMWNPFKGSMWNRVNSGLTPMDPVSMLQVSSEDAASVL
jgi:hypothetical protein